MNKNIIKTKKGGVDTIVAFIVVLLPMVYILIFMVATLYHFGVQMYMNQVVKETLVMASTYGSVTQQMEDHLRGQLENVIGTVTITYHVREFKDDGSVATRVDAARNGSKIVYGVSKTLDKADLLGIYVESADNSLLSQVSNFNIFGAEPNDTTLKYSSYREEIIRNEAP